MAGLASSTVILHDPCQHSRPDCGRHFALWRIGFMLAGDWLHWLDRRLCHHSCWGTGMHCSACLSTEDI